MLELVWETAGEKALREKEITKNGQPHLVVLQGPSLGDVYYLDGESFTVGSDPFRANIVVRDIEVESLHARICRDPEGYSVQDLGTGKGTTVNEEFVKDTYHLSCGDRVMVGESVLEFVEQDSLKEQFHKKIQRLINHDYLTGLMAKNRFDEEFEHALESAQEDDYSLGVLMADIDNLKKINDSYGHLVGEFVVSEIGRIIKDSLVSTEHFATRFGGDEYQVILPNLDKAEAVEFAEDIRRHVEDYTFEHEGILTNPTLALGVASYPEDGAGREVLTEVADQALYRAKNSGGNTVSE